MVICVTVAVPVDAASGGILVDGYDGHVAKFMADGVLVCFGYSVAHEDDAERAVRASLGIVAVMSNDRYASGRRGFLNVVQDEQLVAKWW